MVVTGQSKMSLNATQPVVYAFVPSDWLNFSLGPLTLRPTSSTTLFQPGNLPSLGSIDVRVPRHLFHLTTRAGGNPMLDRIQIEVRNGQPIRFDADEDVLEIPEQSHSRTHSP